MLQRVVLRLALLLFLTFSLRLSAGVQVVPERFDDLAFENDVVAFRLYGPPLRESTERSGLDAWKKRVSYPIVEKWYREHAEGKSYHEDHGEGYDVYHVGSSLGAGGMGLWVDGELVTPNVYQSVEILESRPDRAEFIVEYVYEEPFQNVRERRHYTLEPGSQLVRVRSQFLEDGRPSKQRVAVGVATHDGRAEVTLAADGSRVSTWETIDGRGLGTAALVPSRRDQEAIEVESEQADEGHALILTETDAQGYLVYYAGFAWEGAGEITSAAEWGAYLEAFAQALPERFLVTDPAAGFDTIEEWETFIREVPFSPRRPNDPVYTVNTEATTAQPFIKSVMDRVVDFQTRAYGGEIHIQWQAGTFYTGVFAAYEATGDRAFREAAHAWAEAADWQLDDRILNADTICMGQTMMDLYLEDPKPHYIADIQSAIDAYFDWEVIEDDQLHAPNREFWGENGKVAFNGRNLWWWCDALYMAPPVIARLHTATGEQRYLDLLHELYWDSVDFLYDERSSLFYRDENYFPENQGTNREDEKIFWGRGNGWVYGGIVRTLDHLPEDDPMRQRYLELYQEMTRKLVTLQGPDGFWRPWLNRPDLAQSPETSSTAFFTFGLLAGINRGWIDAESYLPFALDGWNALLSKVSPEGRLGFAQLVAGDPQPVRPESFVDYAHGAFLLAASELYQMELTPDKLTALKPPYDRQLILEDAVWTWYNDERAIIADGHLYVGGVNRAGEVVMLPYAIDPVPAVRVRGKPTVLSTWTERDDHNNPAFLRFDDTLLAVYSKHHTADEWNYRRAHVPEDREWWPLDLQWGEEKTFETDAGSTYANLFQLSEEDGRIYNFYRADGFNPNLAWSDDGGETWEGGFQFILSGDGGTRPYVKYVGNDRNRIDLVYTNGHPRREPDNNVYHLYYEDGAFHDSAGNKVREIGELKTDPIRPAEGTLIYDGSGPMGRAWTHDFAAYPDGTQMAAFITSPDGAEGGDLRYWVATRQPGAATWEARQIAYAGSYLYTRERHYAGGITLDPEQAGVVYISANVDPHDGTANSTGRYQIHRADLPADETAPIAWQQLTFDPHRDNIRPFVPLDHGQETCLLWVHGDYRSYLIYDTDIYGIGF
ncbi:MAG: glycoside hydrolase family 88 protein [Opitutales bacterium]